jgi:hypothetical protein
LTLHAHGQVIIEQQNVIGPRRVDAPITTTGRLTDKQLRKSKIPCKYWRIVRSLPKVYKEFYLFIVYLLQYRFDEISRTLQSVANAYSRVFIIVDAIDECRASGGNRMSFLSELFNLKANCQASIFATSRTFPEIIEMFQESTQLEIKAREQDVRRYLDNHMSDLPWCVHRSSELQAEIRDEIVNAVQGMCVVSHIING